MTHLRSVVRTLLFTILAFVAFPGIGAFAQTTYTMTPDVVTFSNAYYTFLIPMEDANGNQVSISLYDGTSLYTGGYSTAQMHGGQWDGLIFKGPFYSITGVTKDHVGYPSPVYPPPCDGVSCGLLADILTATDPATGNTVTLTLTLDVFVYKSRIVAYEIYSGMAVVSE